MRRNKIFSRALSKVSSLALSGALLATLLPSPGWAMYKEEYQLVTTRPKPSSDIDKLSSNCFQKIFFYLDPRELGKAALVSKMFYYESVKDVCWKPYGVSSKKNYAFYKKNPIATIHNDGSTVSYEIGIAYKTGKYFATDGEAAYGTEINPKEDNSKMGGVYFDLLKVNVTLEEKKETKICVLNLPGEISILEPEEVHGILDLPSGYTDENNEFNLSEIHFFKLNTNWGQLKIKLSNFLKYGKNSQGSNTFFLERL